MSSRQQIIDKEALQMNNCLHFLVQKDAIEILLVIIKWQSIGNNVYLIARLLSNFTLLYKSGYCPTISYYYKQGS